MTIVSDEKKKQELREAARIVERTRMHTKAKQDVEDGKQKTL